MSAFPGARARAAAVPVARATAPPAVRLSAAEARRVALAAQGFGEARPAGPPDARALVAAVDRLGLLQIDSVNVLVRAHYLPLFSRLGPYDAALLDRAAYDGSDRALFEYWGHAASLLPVDSYPLFRWRMARAEQARGLYGSLAKFARLRRPFVQAVLAEITERGPLAAAELSRGTRARGAWWGWSDGKAALEWLFWIGRVTTSARRRFERVYDLTERALPARALAAPVPPEDEAHRALLRRAARALGVATARDLGDYYRLGLGDARPRLAELVEAGELVPATVEGWKDPAYLHAEARAPRHLHGRALLSPFDPLVWERQRAERLFDFHYRIGIYTPVAERAHGYYVLPFLLGDELVARVDLKADRQARVLRVQAAWAEPNAPAETATQLAAELVTLAVWLGLGDVVVTDRGDLAAPLRRVLATG